MQHLDVSAGTRRPVPVAGSSDDESTPDDARGPSSLEPLRSGSPDALVARGDDDPPDDAPEPGCPLLDDAAPGAPARRYPWSRLAAYYGRLFNAFGWRYVALVSLTYGINQGVGEALLFTAQKYYFLDDLKLTPARASQLDGFANIPWQIKAVYGMLSDAAPLWGGLHKAPYMIVAGATGVAAAAALWLMPIASWRPAALLLVLANWSIASPDVMVDGTTAEKSRDHPHLAADLQSLSWGSLYACATLANLGVGYAVAPAGLGARGTFGLCAVTSLAVLIPAAAGWLGDAPRPPRPARDPRRNDDRRRVFGCAAATCMCSVVIGSLEAFYTGPIAVVGSVTAALGLGLAFLLWHALKPISRDLSGAAVYIFLVGALQPSTEVLFAWYHDDGLKHGNCSRHCDDDDDCGWAHDRDYPCIEASYYSQMRAVGRFFGLVGVVLYNAYFSDWKYRDVFVGGHCVLFLANLLDYAWVRRANVSLGIDDRLFLLGVEMIQPVVARIANMPTFVLAAKVCPPDVEATLFALLMGLANFGAARTRRRGISAVWADLCGVGLRASSSLERHNRRGVGESRPFADFCSVGLRASPSL